MATWEYSNSRSNSGACEHANLCLMEDIEDVPYKPNFYHDIASDSWCSLFAEDRIMIYLLRISLLVITISEKYIELKQNLKL